MDGRELLRICATAISTVCVMWYRYQLLVKEKVHESSLSRRNFVVEILSGQPRNCYDLLRMNASCFMLLANELRRRGFMKDSCVMNVEELAIFLYTIGHSERNQVVLDQFQHSEETIGRFFNSTLHAILKLAKYYVKPSDGECPPEIRNNPLFYPYFKDCLGAIDGIHIPAWVRHEDQVRYCNRKGALSQNVMVVVSFDMRFQYVYAGWEGSASDSRILQDAVWRRPSNRLIVPTGKYYLVDANYANTYGFLAPFRGVRYHMEEWSTTQVPSTGQELFNLYHSKLHNVVERTFAMLKQRFALLQTAPCYPLKTQAKIVVACCVLHNFIQQWNFDDEFSEVATNGMPEDEDMDDDPPRNNYTGPTDADRNYMNQFREQLTEQIWAAKGGS